MTLHQQQYIPLYSTDRHQGRPGKILFSAVTCLLRGWRIPPKKKSKMVWPFSSVSFELHLPISFAVVCLAPQHQQLHLRHVLSNLDTNGTQRGSAKITPPTRSNGSSQNSPHRSRPRRRTSPSSASTPVVTRGFSRSTQLLRGSFTWLS